MTCPRCSVAELSPLTGICELCGYAAEATVAVAPADATIELARRQLSHEFEFEQPLGRGLRSHVFRAREKGSKREVVLKVLPRRTDEADAEESFRTTLTAFAGFDHPHLLRILRFGSTDSLFWYATEPVESTSLRELLRQRRRMGPRSCRRIATQVVNALEYLHRRGVVHGAIKAENVFVDKEGWVHVADPTFLRARPQPLALPPAGGSTAAGAAAEAAARPPALSADGTVRPSWIAPEEFARGERLPAADQYALAALIYECLTGHLPADPPIPIHRERADVPASIARAVDRALADDPWRRFPSCADLLWALEDDATAPAPEARPTGRITQDVVLINGWEPPADPWRPLVAVGRSVVAVVAAAVLWFSAPYVWNLIQNKPTGGPASVTNNLAPTRERTPVPSAAQAAEPLAATSPATRRTTPPAGQGEQPAPAGARATVPGPVVPPVSPGTRSSTSAPPRAGMGKLLVNSTPWGQIYVDGALVGNTPKGDIELSAGTHQLRIVRTEFAPYERTVTITAGETLRITDIVLEPQRP
ncbi:MAG: protein kinase [Gemmatimonadota bacterium]|nr:protein kinase [Gemmatimonadota bacterium]